MPLKYIHYTSCASLYMTKLTGLSFVPLSDLLYQHRLSPLAGEVGYAIGYHTSIAKIAFLKYSDGVYFSERSIYGDSGRGTNNARIQSVEDLHASLDSFLGDDPYGYNVKGIQPIIANTLHAKQVGILPSEGAILAADTAVAYHAKIESMRQLHLRYMQVAYLICMWIDASIFIDFDLREKLETEIRRVGPAIVPPHFSSLSHEAQLKIAAAFYDALFAGELSEYKHSFKVRFNSYPLDTPNGKFSKLSDVTRIPEFFENIDSPIVDAIKLPLKFRFTTLFGRGLSLRPKFFSNAVAAFTERFNSAIADFNFKFAFLQNILDGKIGRKLPLAYIDAADDPFPIAIVLTDEFDASMDEHFTPPEVRCRHALQLGTQIRHIAVEAANAAKVQEFLKAHDLEDQIQILDMATSEPIATSQYEKCRYA